MQGKNQCIHKLTIYSYFQIVFIILFCLFFTTLAIYATIIHSEIKLLFLDFLILAVTIYQLSILHKVIFSNSKTITVQNEGYLIQTKQNEEIFVPINKVKKINAIELHCSRFIRFDYVKIITDNDVIFTLVIPNTYKKDFMYDSILKYEYLEDFREKL